MEWLNERLNFSSGDLSLLEFVPRVPFRVHTVSIRKDEQVSAYFFSLFHSPDMALLLTRQISSH